MKKILGIILGVLTFICGIYCLANPAIALSSVLIVFAITLIVEAIGYFMLWLEIRNIKQSGLLLLNAILTFIAGILLLTNNFAQIFAGSMLITIISIYMVCQGITTIANSFKLKDSIKTSSWVLILVFGILVTIAGISSFFNPITLLLTIGIIISIDIMIAGLCLIAVSFAANR